MTGTPLQFDKKNHGFQRQYDPDILAEELLEWVEDEEAINIAQFCADRGYVPSLIWSLEKQNGYFTYALQIAKLKIAERRERLVNADLLNSGIFHRYQACYDIFLRKDEDDEKDKEAARKRGVVESEQLNLVKLAQMAADGKLSQK